MYTRTYNDDARGIIIPESYGGTALSDNKGIESEGGDKQKSNPWEEETKEASSEPIEEKSEAAFSPLSKLRIPAFISEIFKNSNLSLQKIGTEEILLIGVAAFLFFSKDGDKELAIMLLILLFL